MLTRDSHEDNPGDAFTSDLNIGQYIILIIVF